MLSPTTLPEIQQALADADLDGWLLFDFRGVNPIAKELIGLEGKVTRRVFAWVPREGLPEGVSHAIEQAPWAGWPQEWPKHVYSSWRALEETLRGLVGGQRVAMEYSPGDAVPYVDRVPAGVLELVRASGAQVEASADLVTRFYAVWSDEQRASHERAAETISEIAQEALRHAGEQARAGKPVTEHELQRRILDQFAARGLETESPPAVAIGANAA